jgi:hypothetical protein
MIIFGLCIYSQIRVLNLISIIEIKFETRSQMLKSNLILDLKFFFYNLLNIQIL